MLIITVWIQHFVGDHLAVKYTPIVIVERMSYDTVTFPYRSTGCTSEFTVLNHQFGRKSFISLAFATAPKEVVWYRKIRQEGGPGVVYTRRNESVWEHCPWELNGNVLCEELHQTWLHADGQYGSTLQASGLQISNTIRCFLCICQHTVNVTKI